MNFQDYFEREFPHDFLDQAIRGLPGVYRSAHARTFGDHPSEQARDLFPHNLRCLVDEHLIATASHFKRLEPTNKLNGAKNSNHVEVWGGSVVLTASTVRSPRQFVRRSNFREALATWNQLTLFPDFAPRPAGNQVYGIIIHGYGDGGRDKVDFVCLGIPDDDYSAYVLVVDLLNYYAIDLYPEIRKETIEDMAEPKIKVVPRIRREAQ